MKKNLLNYLFIPILLLGISIGVYTILILTNNYPIYSNIKLKLNGVKLLVPVLVPKTILIISLIVNKFCLILYTICATNYLKDNNKINIIINNILISFLIITNFIFLMYIPLKNNNFIKYLLVIYLSLLLSELIKNYASLLNITQTKHIISTKMLIENSIGVALCVILSFMADLISPRFPQIMGGFRLSLTVVPILIIAFRNGLVSGIITGLVYSIFNVFLDGGIYHIGSLFLDYLIPFSLIGLVGIYKHLKKDNLFIVISLIILVSIIKYISHSLSGILFFRAWAPSGVNYIIYSFIFVNMPKVFIEMLLQIIIISASYKYLIKKH